MNPGWAAKAHVSAIRAVPDHELRAVSTSYRDPSDASAKAFGVTAHKGGTTRSTRSACRPPGLRISFQDARAGSGIIIHISSIQRRLPLFEASLGSDQDRVDHIQQGGRESPRLKGAVPQIDLKDIYIGMLQFNVIQNLAVVLVLFFPKLATWLPTLLFG